MNCPICQCETLFKSKISKELYYLTCQSQCFRSVVEEKTKEIITYHLQMVIDGNTYQFSSTASRPKIRERAWFCIYKQDTSETEFIAHSFRKMMELDKHVPLKDIGNPEQFFRRFIKLRIFA